MRDEQDIIQVTLTVVGNIELDLERIEADPNWRQVLSAGWDLDTPEGRLGALQDYLGHYITRELFLREMPSTNVPGSIRLIELEVTSNGNRSASVSTDEEGRGASTDTGVHTSDQ